MSNIGKIKLDEYKPLRDIVFETLRNAIIDADLEPGQRLMEIQLAEELGVSRTPVREAIRKLELEGLVIMLPRKGAYVADMSLKDITDILEIRANLESLAAQLAADKRTENDIEILRSILDKFKISILNNDVDESLKLDEEFHSKILTIANNYKLSDMVSSIWEQVYRFRLNYISDVHISLKLVEEHENMVQAIEAGNRVEAGLYAQKHIEKAQEYMVEGSKVN